MILSKYAICAIKKIKYVQKQETSRLLSKLRAKVSLSKASILADILFWWVLEIRCKTNEVVNKFFLSGDTFILEMHLIHFFDYMLKENLKYP